jgi:hypothetical protein
MRATLPQLCALLVAFVPAGCKHGREPSGTPLPERSPTAPVLEFTGPDQGYPPQPVGISNVREVPFAQFAPLSGPRPAELRRLAERDERVRRALGERFAFLSADPVEPPKREGESRPSDAARLTFYSYSANVAVEVLTNADRVESARELARGYQPPESQEEIATATRMALADARLRETNAGTLQPNGIVAYPREGQPGHGNRVLQITFAKDGEDLPAYVAYVDLTAGKVLSAGKSEH